MENTQKEKKYLLAKERVETVKKFYSKLLCYGVFIAFLAALNYWTNQWSYAWFLWVAFGWGIGIILCAIKTFGLNPFFGKDWEKRKIEKFMKEEEPSQRWE